MYYIYFIVVWFYINFVQYNICVICIHQKNAMSPSNYLVLFIYKHMNKYPFM